MSYEKDLVKFLKENAFKDQGYELIHDDIYGKSGIYLSKDPIKVDIATLAIPEDMKNLEAYKSFIDRQMGHEVVSDECGKFFMFDDGSVLFVKKDPDGEDEYYLYKEVYFDKAIEPFHMDTPLAEDEKTNTEKQNLGEDQVFINLTPHPINLNGKQIPPEAQPARCTTSTEVIDTINGVEIRKKTFGEVYGLPEPIEGKFYIVSSIVAQALNGTRDDVLITDGAIRDESGHIVGCTGLAKV